MALSDRRLWHGTWRRIHQGIRSLNPTDQHIPFPEEYSGLVPPGVVLHWKALAAYDRQHMRNVATDLHRNGATQHVILAGLLHDIGKPQKPATLARIAHVVVQWLGPTSAAVVVRAGASLPGMSTLRALITHPQAGATLLALHHAPTRIVWLVGHHHADFDDAELRQLQAADERN